MKNTVYLSQKTLVAFCVCLYLIFMVGCQARVPQEPQQETTPPSESSQQNSGPSEDSIIAAFDVWRTFGPSVDYHFSSAPELKLTDLVDICANHCFNTGNTEHLTLDEIFQVEYIPKDYLETFASDYFGVDANDLDDADEIYSEVQGGYRVPPLPYPAESINLLKSETEGNVVLFTIEYKLDDENSKTLVVKVQFEDGDYRFQSLTN